MAVSLSDPLLQAFLMVDTSLRVARSVRPAVDQYMKQWRECDSCRLARQRPCRTNTVHFRGYLPTDVAYIGEAPGDEEDLAGKPFVGPSGRCLEEIIEDVQKREPHKALICNVLGCIPRKNAIGEVRRPHPREVELCQPRLIHLLRIAQPKVIVLVGKTAKESVPPLQFQQFPSPQDVVKCQAEPQRWTALTCHINHPAWLLRQGSSKQRIERQRYVLRIAQTISRMKNNARALSTEKRTDQDR